MNKGIILFSKAVETLEFFSNQIGEAAKLKGYDILSVNMNETKTSVVKIEDFAKSHDCVVLTFNFIGFSKETFLQVENESIWQKLSLKCKVILVDHPLYYHEQLCSFDKDYKGGEIYVVDKDHIKYLQDYYPEIEKDKIHFLPLAGTSVKKAILPVKERPIDLLFTGNYVRKERLHSYLEDLSQEYIDFYESIIEKLKKNSSLSIQQVLEQFLLPMFPEATYKELREAIHGMMYVDLYIRSYYRSLFIKELVEAGLDVVVIGKDWEYLDVSNTAKKHLKLVGNGMEDTKFCLDYTSKTKISLNIMPWFKNGLHDRVVSAMCNGAVSFTDSSKYMLEEFQNQKELVYFELDDILNNPEKIISSIKVLLEHEDLMENIAKNGYQRATEKHTWNNRLEILGI